MLLAGIDVPDRDITLLARQLRERGFDRTAARLETAHRLEPGCVGLSVDERMKIACVIDDRAGIELAQLRRTLVRAL